MRGHLRKLVYRRLLFTASPASDQVNRAGDVAEAERVIVTGSNIPTAEEVGPNPVDTYRSEDIEIRLSSPEALRTATMSPPSTSKDVFGTFP
jgi:fructose-specific component phosphotransferase system IIB-like protein